MKQALYLIKELNNRLRPLFADGILQALGLQSSDVTPQANQTTKAFFF